MTNDTVVSIAETESLVALETITKNNRDGIDGIRYYVVALRHYQARTRRLVSLVSSVGTLL
jgi:hypothetical protein